MRYLFLRQELTVLSRRKWIFWMPVIASLLILTAIPVLNNPSRMNRNNFTHSLIRMTEMEPVIGFMSIILPGLIVLAVAVFTLIMFSASFQEHISPQRIGILSLTPTGPVRMILEIVLSRVVVLLFICLSIIPGLILLYRGVDLPPYHQLYMLGKQVFAQFLIVSGMCLLIAFFFRNPKISIILTGTLLIISLLFCYPSAIGVMVKYISVGGFRYGNWRTKTSVPVEARIYVGALLFLVGFMAFSLRAKRPLWPYLEDFLGWLPRKIRSLGTSRYFRPVVGNLEQSSRPESWLICNHAGFLTIRLSIYMTIMIMIPLTFFAIEKGHLGLLIALQLTLVGAAWISHIYSSGKYIHMLPETINLAIKEDRYRVRIAIYYQTFIWFISLIVPIWFYSFFSAYFDQTSAWPRYRMVRILQDLSPYAGTEMALSLLLLGLILLVQFIRKRKFPLLKATVLWIGLQIIGSWIYTLMANQHNFALFANKDTAWWKLLLWPIVNTYTQEITSVFLLIFIITLYVIISLLRGTPYPSMKECRRKVR